MNRFFPLPVEKLDYVKFVEGFKAKFVKLSKEVDKENREEFNATMRYNGTRMSQFSIKKFDKLYLKDDYDDASFRRADTNEGTECILEPIVAYITPFIIPNNNNSIPNAELLNKKISYFIDPDNAADKDKLQWGKKDKRLSKLTPVGPRNMPHSCRNSNTIAEDLNVSLNQSESTLRGFYICEATADKKSYTVTNKLHIMTEDEYKSKFQETEEGKKRWKAKQKHIGLYGGACELELNLETNEFEPLHPQFKVVAKSTGQFSQCTSSFGLASGVMKKIKPTFASATGIFTLNQRGERIEAYINPSSDESCFGLAQENSAIDQMLVQQQQQQQNKMVLKMSNEELQLLNMKFRNKFSDGDYHVNEKLIDQRHNELRKKLGQTSTSFSVYIREKRQQVDPKIEKLTKLNSAFESKLSKNKIREERFFGCKTLQQYAMEYLEQQSQGKGITRRPPPKGNNNDNSNDNDNDNDNSSTDITVLLEENSDEENSDEENLDEENSDDNSNKIELNSFNKRKRSKKDQEKGDRIQGIKKRKMERKKERKKEYSKKELVDAMHTVIVETPVLNLGIVLGGVREKMYHSFGERIKRLAGKKLRKKEKQKENEKEKEQSQESAKDKGAATYMVKVEKHPKYLYSIDSHNGVK